MSFLYPSLVSIGLPLVLVPLVIHLINPRRQRTIRWAAMQFLQESQRRNRSWILLRQWLLIALRMAAIALLALLLGGTVLQDSWARLFGTAETHHVVIIDDSYSMGDRANDADAVDRAKQVVEHLVAHVYRQSNSARLTLLTFSDAARLTAAEEPATFQQPLNDELRSRLPSLLARIQATQSAVGPAEALRGVARLPEPATQQSQVLHVLSDFRARHFVDSTEPAEQLRQLAKVFDHIHLVQCVREARPNLAITSLAPEAGLPAAGVESWMTMSVKNFGTEMARNVPVRMEQDGTPLPAIVLEEIPPREEVSHRFRFRLNGVGVHSLTASLVADSVEADNQRYFACDLLPAVPVLLVDDSTDSRDAYFLAKALQPGGAAHTGWQPQVERPEFLRDAQPLPQFAAICLLDVGRLDEPAISALENYVQNGGGVAFFTGENVQSPFYNEKLYNDGSGLFPVPLKLPKQLLRSSGETRPDVVVVDHPLFHALAGERNSFLQLLSINYYFAVSDDWNPVDAENISVLAQVRNEAPLVVERRVAKGRVVAHLFKLSPTQDRLGPWTNWSVNPVFPVLANELMRYLSSDRAAQNHHRVGDTLSWVVDGENYSGDYRFLLPRSGPTRREVVAEAELLDDAWQVRLEDVPTSGIYELRLPNIGGGENRRLFAVNVDAAEGDLVILDRAELVERLDGDRYEFHFADELQVVDDQVAGFHLGGTLLGLLLAVLIGEQLLAWLASYHTSTLGVRPS